MKQITLSRGHAALVDDEDYEYLSQFNWYFKRGYAVRAVKNPAGKPRQITANMHRTILGLEYGDPRLGDHKDGDGLNNQRANLRICTPTENSCNRKIGVNNTSGYKGVTWVKNNNAWQASIRINGVGKYLGLFKTAEEAHEKYCEAAKELHGEFASIDMKARWSKFPTASFDVSIMSAAQIDTLVALVERGPLEDWDVPSISGRDDLIDAGLAVGVVAKGSDGFTAATYAGREIYLKRYDASTILEAMAVRKTSVHVAHRSAEMK